MTVELSPAPKNYAPATVAPTTFARGATSMTALLPNGPIEAGSSSYFLTRGTDGPARQAFASEDGTLALGATNQGFRRKVETTTGLITVPTPDSSTLLNPLSFGVAMWFRPGADSTAAPWDGDDLNLFDWRNATSTRFLLVDFLDLAGESALRFRKSIIGTTDTAQQAATWVAGDDVLIVFGADATTVYMSVDGADYTSTAGTQDPTSLLADREISVGAAPLAPDDQIDCPWGPLYIKDKPFTQAEIVALWRSRWVPLGWPEAA